MRNLKLSARKRLLSILPRSVLEDQADISRPYLASKAFLISTILEKWDQAKIEYEIKKILKDAE